MARTHEDRSAGCWSTDDVEQRRALAYWVDTVCDRFIALDIDTPLRGRFRARLEQVDFGVVTANFLQADSQHIYRTRARIARSHHPVFVLLQLRAGQVCLRQSGREAYVRPGQCVLMDGTQPYRIDCPQPTQALALRLPTAWLRRWLPSPEQLTARPFAGGGWSAALNAALASIELESCNDLALPRGTVAEQIAALLSLAAGRDSPATRRPPLFGALMGTLRDRLHEADLSPAALAAAHGISRRTLYYAFAGAGTTFTAELMRLRLEHARELLGDPRFGDLAIAEVAARCGFNEPSHFARRFRQRFAQPPMQFRSSAKRAHD